MPSQEVKDKVTAVLEEAAKHFDMSKIELTSYSPDALELVFKSLAYTCAAAAAVIKTNQFKTETDAIDFCGLVGDLIIVTTGRNIEGLAHLKANIRIRQSKKN